MRVSYHELDRTAVGLGVQARMKLAHAQSEGDAIQQL